MLKLVHANAQYGSTTVNPKSCTLVLNRRYKYITCTLHVHPAIYSSINIQPRLHPNWKTAANLHCSASCLTIHLFTTLLQFPNTPSANPYEFCINFNESCQFIILHYGPAISPAIGCIFSSSTPVHVQLHYMCMHYMAHSVEGSGLASWGER